MKQQIKITLYEGVDPDCGMAAVSAVIREGRISQSKTRKLYCAFSEIRVGRNMYGVYVPDTKKIDTFHVHII